MSFKFKVKIPLLQKVIFFKHLSAMLEAGLTLSESIETLGDQVSSKNFRSILKKAYMNLENGLTLKQSFEKYPSVFSPLVLSMIHIGETTGNLGDVLKYISEQMEKSYEIRRKIVSAFIYPGIVLSLTGSLVIFLLIFAIPKITEILKTFNAPLPTSTKVIITASNIIRLHYGYLISGIILAIAGLKILFKLPAVKKTKDIIKLKIPLFGELIKKSNIALFARSLCSLLQSGIPIVEALRITSDNVGNYNYKNAIIDIANKVEQGERLAKSMEVYPKLFPAIIMKMFSVGEKIGNLDKSSLHIADMYEKEVEQSTKNLSTVLEPLLLLFMGLTVGGIAVSIMTPIYDISSSAMR